MTVRSMRAWIISGAIAMSAGVAWAALPGERLARLPDAADIGLRGADATRWDALRDESTGLRASARSTARRDLDALRASLATDAPDLAAFGRQVDADVDAHLAASRDWRARLLAFYDGLPEPSKAAFRANLRGRLDRLARWRDAFADPLPMP